MTTKYTPGPWMISEEPDSDGTFFAIRSSRGFLIAATATYDLRKDRAANAQLIAAAPDLAEALQAILDTPAVHFTEDAIDNASRTMEEVRNIARAALQKAGLVS